MPAILPPPGRRFQPEEPRLKSRAWSRANQPPCAAAGAWAASP